MVIEGGRLSEMSGGQKPRTEFDPYRGFQEFLFGLRQRRPEAVGVFIGLYGELIRRKISGFSQEDSGVAQDIESSYWEKLYSNFPRLDPTQTHPSRLRSWSMYVLRSSAIDNHRKNIARREDFRGLNPHLSYVSGDSYIEDNESAPARERRYHPSAEDEYFERRKKEQLWALVEGLTNPRQREVIRLLYGEGLTHLEAASKLGIPLGTVKSADRYAKATLKEAARSVFEFS
ncbi:MAG: RNA polymerase, sigma-24 subunit, ECF subfamily [Candidatus Daviesbacteria bacterium GW2011_GWA2_38_24]|uniref:RNA polymerase, sigma-24 subunit, ECF subfamily n=1 Tax=Candidatus Daviesbacteria bacterium GW2011_GWA2_38_24 TaxID=1618422 RepID=A0A0G0JV16_9BACT|nr:MAG: RNA polymerase, sigma-24 subunit, ECF subfamily [Candidatus Daviesbacteria bacterium GW2011_GWA2_38_24]KKQ80003.1 MAG: RNA polymerase, sigma-24 subunit, ECF subfamily [Candidatus Daviesbacteria bacterium GW2011_GWA1_38_7]OGE24607.1 MAG: hypothetical protein A2688_00355 [Candidatus Daviesbacteria bacterium RIFCSPHIGHO2_01_FULL_38_8]